MKEIKLVISDVDGTIVNDQRIVPSKNSEAIKKLKDQGILFGIASGRPYTNVKESCVNWGIFEYMDYIVGSNGAQVYDIKNDKLECNHWLSPEFVIEMERSYRHLNCAVAVYRGNILCVNKSSSAVINQAKKVNMEVQVIDFEHEIKESYPKILIISEEGDQADILAYYQEAKHDDYHLFPSSINLLHLVDSRISKASGVSVLANKHGLNKNQVLCFGDASNDFEMLSEFVGVCMKNGSDDVQKIANYHTISNNEAGVGAFITEYLLNKK